MVAAQMNVKVGHRNPKGGLAMAISYIEAVITHASAAENRKAPHRCRAL